jgi:cysteine desulfurase / selenocysteine lyase
VGIGYNADRKHRGRNTAGRTHAEDGCALISCLMDGESASQFEVQSLRAFEFPWALAGDVTYLNHAGTGPLPARSVAAMNTWAMLQQQPWTAPDRDIVFPMYARVRALCAQLVGLSAEEIALVPNTSHALNLAARMLRLSPGDVVVTSAGEFPSVVNAWRTQRERDGIGLKLVPQCDGYPDEGEILRALDDERVKVLTLSWVSFSNGYRVDLDRLGSACRERGIRFIVDGIQGAGVASLDLRACNVDFFACGGAKWLLSPWGTGFLAVRKELIAELDPAMVGWLTGPGSENYASLLDYHLPYYRDARRFEVGTLAAQSLAALEASGGLLLELGIPNIEQHVRKLVDRVVAWAQDDNRTKLITPADRNRRAGIVAFTPPNIDAVSARLRSAGIHHSVREGAIRLSPFIHTTEADIDRTLELVL